jgi:transcriptional regulator with PAS, ATPase and Fis domain
VNGKKTFQRSSLFHRKVQIEFGRRIKGISDSSLKALMEYHWPGNIRQLEAVIERLCS